MFSLDDSASERLGWVSRITTGVSRVLMPFRLVHSYGVFDVNGCKEKDREGWRISSQLQFKDVYDPSTEWTTWEYKFALSTR